MLYVDLVKLLNPNCSPAQEPTLFSRCRDGLQKRSPGQKRLSSLLFSGWRKGRPNNRRRRHTRARKKVKGRQFNCPGFIRGAKIKILIVVRAIRSTEKVVILLEPPSEVWHSGLSVSSQEES